MQTTIRRVASLLLAVAAITITPVVAHADYGSGTWGGPVGSPTQSASWATPDVVVGIAGDSIVARCNSDLASKLSTEAGVTLAVRSWSGQNTTNTVTWAKSLTYKPDFLIIAAGTNDIFDPTVMTAQIDSMKAAMPAGKTLVWTDVQAARPATDLADQRNSGWINTEVHQGLPAGQVVDWAAAVAALAGSTRPGIAYYLQDGVHPWAAAGTGHGDGCAFWAEVQMQTLRPLLGL